MEWERHWLEVGDIDWEFESTLWETPYCPTMGSWVSRFGDQAVEWAAVFPGSGTKQLEETVGLENHLPSRSASDSTAVGRRALFNCLPSSALHIM